MKVLITGITGFVGSHLADYCLKNGHQVYGTKRWRSKMDNTEHLESIKFRECDLTDAHSVKNLIAEIKPERIFHLAAQSYVPASWINPAQTIDNNVQSELNIFEAVRGIKDYNPRIHIAGSSEEYGNAEIPITEDASLNPVSPYGVSKVAQDLLARQYVKSYGMDIVITRSFNHTGPRRGEVFVCSNFAKQIVNIEKGKQQIIKVGNLDAERDFTDVRDMVKAYWLALDYCKAGEVYNICSEKMYSIKSILNKLISLSKKKIVIEKDETRMRPSDLVKLLGDCSKFKKLTGWKPEINISQTLKDILNYWREK